MQDTPTWLVLTFMPTVMALAHIARGAAYVLRREERRVVVEYVFTMAYAAIGGAFLSIAHIGAR